VSGAPSIINHADTQDREATLAHLLELSRGIRPQGALGGDGGGQGNCRRSDLQARDLHCYISFLLRVDKFMLIVAMIKKNCYWWMGAVIRNYKMRKFDFRINNGCWLPTFLGYANDSRKSWQHDCVVA
jgi:hypothetical protein